ncbi:hypothetical protein LVJ94_43455 [Pendulispora rubella]|uniref:Uncharacterized protein n=1 Tax=Pendulispora rubella TaxID=2741070 RepID=A0ABZ2L3G6_9BACT
MHLHRSGIVVFAFATASLLAASACTALLDRDSKQCSSDGECKHFSQSATCVENVCKVASQSDAGLGPPGCFSGTPKTDLEFYNQCTTADFKQYDNCHSLGLCDGAAYDPAALVDPPDAGSEPPSDGGVNLPTAKCYDANERPKVIYMQGSTNFTPFIQAMAPLVHARGYTIVWQPTSSCAGAAAAGFDTPAKTLMRNPTNASQSPASYYDANGNGTPCLLGSGPNSPDPNGETTDVGESDVFAASCGNAAWVPGAGAFASIGHSTGPIQAMVFATPPGSDQRAISAEAAHMVFGMGGNGGVAKPWIDPNFIWNRSATTGTNNILSRGIDVPPTRWWGVDKKTGPAMRDAILTASVDVAKKTIGTMSLDLADKVKAGLHILYFQARGQIAGFLPDSSPAANDKKNVRDGHYPLWGPIHLYTKLQNSQPSPAAAAFLLPFAVPNQALLDATIAGGFVPLCAMSVSRDTEMGQLKSAEPDFQCHCYYESKVGGAAPKDCKPCGGPSECSSDAPACNIGFCQKK